ncbi:Hypothetical protein A7982_08433 [Minicystis rosea]|nr:Hypothetical protein A7982_08433 [Minicystis rosea]
MRARAIARILSIVATITAIPAAARGDEPPAAKAATTSIVLLPTAIADEGSRSPTHAGGLGRLAQTLDALLAETAQDLGLAVVPPPRGPTRLGDQDLVARARDTHGLVLLPSLRALESGDVELRLALAGPDGRAVDVLREQVSRADLSVRAVILLRNLVRRHGRPSARPPSAAPSGTPVTTSLLKSPGRISLIANATVFGGLVGYSIQRASGANDPRLLYPLVVVGAGIGLGASFLASGEWEVKPGDAWYWAAGAWWPSAAGHLIFQGRFAAHRPDSERWVYGLLGGTAGVTLASLGLALHSMEGGNAVMAHSGGGLGMAFGALVEMASRGDVRHTPFAGMGYGAGLGWLAAAAVATQVDADALRVLAFDLGVIVGGLTGAAAGSPLLLGETTEAKQRAWAGITAGSALAGGVVSAIVFRPRRPAKLADLRGQPLIGVLGESRLGTLSAPILGAGWSGVLE